MMKARGCDASNKFDEENLEVVDQYFSDDEKEMAIKSLKKKAKKQKNQ